MKFTKEDLDKDNLDGVIDALEKIKMNQNLLKNLPYGMKQSNYNGCGGIAAYNFLHACGRQKEYDTVRQQLEDSLIFGGLFGTHIMQLYLYLRRHFICIGPAGQKQRKSRRSGVK